MIDFSGKCRSWRRRIITSPTAPLAPTTATLFTAGWSFPGDRCTATQDGPDAETRACEAGFGSSRPTDRELIQDIVAEGPPGRADSRREMACRRARSLSIMGAGREDRRSGLPEDGPLNVLVVGKGGREHALCWKLKQSPKVKAVFCAPGNAGTADRRPERADRARGHPRLIQFAKRKDIRLTVVGPEEPLANGIVDAFQREGLRIFGPAKDAAELEGSKVFAKDLMRQAGIPTADYRVFRSAPDAEHWVLAREVSLVVRSRGRSTLRHTLLCRTAAETLENVDRIMDPREQMGPGRAGRDRGDGARSGSSTRRPRRGITSWAGRWAWC